MAMQLSGRSSLRASRGSSVCSSWIRAAATLRVMTPPPVKAEKHTVIIDYDDDASDDPDRECLLSKYLALVLLLVLSAFIYFVLVQQYLMAAI
ncbi:hypothetical protein FI667_g12802, partial [Globisporangium splendens]